MKHPASSVKQKRDHHDDEAHPVARGRPGPHAVDQGLTRSTRVSRGRRRSHASPVQLANCERARSERSSGTIIRPMTHQGPLDKWPPSRGARAIHELGTSHPSRRSPVVRRVPREKSARRVNGDDDRRQANRAPLEHSGIGAAAAGSGRQGARLFSLFHVKR